MFEGHCREHRGGHDCRHRARSGFDAFMGEFWGGHRGHFRGRGRMFEQGDLRYVILRLLDEKPRHGYDIIKELEERSAGAYSPSPGTVYPTLTLLEDQGFARAREEEGGRKIYEITDEGRRHLAEHSSTVDDIFSRISRFVEGFVDTPMMEVNQAFAGLGRTAFRTASRNVQDREKLARIKEILDRAAREIEELGK